MSTALSVLGDTIDRQRKMIIKARRSGNSTPSTIFDQGGAYGVLGAQNQDTYTTEMAYTHNRGEPYAATRPISQRIAGQPAHVAEIVRGKQGISGDKAWREPKKGRRRMSIEEMSKLPKWMRNRLKLPVTDDKAEFVKAVKAAHSAAVRVDILEEHPVLDLLSQPNPRMNGHTLIDTSIVSLMFTGKCYWWLDDKAVGRPYNLFYIPAHRVREAPDNVMLDQGYYVAPPAHVGGPDIPIPAKWMIYFYHPDPSDPMRALAPIRACMQNVRVGESIVTCQEQTFNNGCYPGLAVITGDIINPDGKNIGKAQMDRFQVAELMTRIEQFHRSPMKHNRLLVMDRMINDVKQISNKPNEMDFMQSSEYNRDAIWRAIGTPRVVSGDVQDANRATALVADEAFIGNSLNPRTTLLSHVMNDQLLPLFSDDSEELMMWIEEATSVDRDATLKELTMMLPKRGCTIDEARAELFGWPALPNDKGKVLISSATDIIEPIDDSQDDVVAYREEFISDQAQAAKPAKPPAENKPRQTPPPSADETATGKSFDPSMDSGHGTKGQVEIWLKLHGRQEQPFQRDIKKFLDAQTRYIVSQMEKEVDPSEFFNPREWDNGLIRVAKPHLRQCAMTGARSILDTGANLRQSEVETKDGFEFSPEVLKAIKDFLDNVVKMQYWREINNTTGQRLADQIRDGLKAGETMPQMTERVKSALGTQSNARALMIARSETTGSLNAGAMVGIEDLKRQGLVSGAKWLATDDSHVRPTHWAANGQQQDANGEFTVGGHKCRFPADPSLPPEERCNCILPGAVIRGSYVAATKSFYSGKATEVVLRSGRRLSLTPNHRVLTSGGFVRAAHLKRGQYLISDNREIDAPIVPDCSSGDYVNYSPALIENVFEAFLGRPSSSRKIEVRRAKMDDFHGDGKFLNGDIEIVTVERQLLDCVESCEIEEPIDSVLVLKPHRTSIAKSANRPSVGSAGRVWLRSSRGMGFSNLIGSRFSGHGLPLQSLCFGSTANFDSGLNESQKESAPVVAGFIGKLLKRCPGDIFIDEIVEIRNFDFSGHVYDLQSETGLIVANGICISNCRCGIVSSRAQIRSVKSLLVGPGEMFERVERRFIVSDCAPIIQQLLEHGRIREYGISTLYLDYRVPTWSLHRGNGVKFRLRQYDTGELFFEQKVKQDGVTFKKRRKATFEDSSKDLIPIGLAKYTRTEFEQNGSRVTVDRDVMLNGSPLGKYIVEVKGKMPKWLELPENSEQIGFSKSSAILNYGA